MKTFKKTFMFWVIVFIWMFALPSYRTEAHNSRKVSASNNQSLDARKMTLVNKGVTPQESLIATFIAPGLGKSWQGHSTYEGEYTTLFVGNNAQGDWPHCSGSIDQIEVQPLSGGTTIIEDFSDPTVFTQVGTTVYISGGKAVFDHFYMSGGPQFVYRSIPTFSGPVSIKVIGQLDWAENNCGVIAGIADDHLIEPSQPTSYPGIAYRFFGGGCSVSGPLVSAPGTDVETEYTSDGCSFTPDGAPWFAWSTPFEADLIETESAAYTISGQVTYASGDPFQGVLVSTDIGFNATTNASGYYTISNLITATYVVTASTPGFSFLPAYHQVSLPPDATEINFMAIPLKPLYFPLMISDFSPGQRFGTVAGVVTRIYTNSPIPGAQVCVLSTRQCDLTDQNGFYEIPNILVGDQSIRTQARGYRYQDKTVQIRPDQTVLLDFALLPNMITVTMSPTPTHSPMHSPTGTPLPPVKPDCQGQSPQCYFEAPTPDFPTLTVTPPPP
jgi:hypothetical protein